MPPWEIFLNYFLRGLHLLCIQYSLTTTYKFKNMLITKVRLND